METELPGLVPQGEYEHHKSALSRGYCRLTASGCCGLRASDSVPAAVTIWQGKADLERFATSRHQRGPAQCSAGGSAAYKVPATGDAAKAAAQVSVTKTQYLYVRCVWPLRLGEGEQWKDVLSMSEEAFNGWRRRTLVAQLRRYMGTCRSAAKIQHGDWAEQGTCVCRNINYQCVHLDCTAVG
jgi:hypothetical protein